MVFLGRNLYPAAGYLFMVWETLAIMQGYLFSDIPVVFEDVRFLRATNIEKRLIHFLISIQDSSGSFEVRMAWLDFLG